MTKSHHSQRFFWTKRPNRRFDLDNNSMLKPTNFSRQKGCAIRAQWSSFPKCCKKLIPLLRALWCEYIFGSQGIFTILSLRTNTVNVESLLLKRLSIRSFEPTQQTKQTKWQTHAYIVSTNTMSDALLVRSFQNLPDLNVWRKSSLSIFAFKLTCWLANGQTAWWTSIYQNTVAEPFVLEIAVWSDLGSVPRPLSGPVRLYSVRSHAESDPRASQNQRRGEASTCLKRTEK